MNRETKRTNKTNITIFAKWTFLVYFGLLTKPTFSFVLLFLFWWFQAKRSQNSGYFLHFIALIFCSFRGNGFTFNGIDMQLNHITACLSSDKCEVFYGPSTFKWIFCSKLSRWTFNCLPEFRSCLYPSCRISSGRLIKRILWWLVANVGQWKI